MEIIYKTAKLFLPEFIGFFVGFFACTLLLRFKSYSWEASIKKSLLIMILVVILSCAIDYIINYIDL